jgi:hypothetical protein
MRQHDRVDRREVHTEHVHVAKKDFGVGAGIKRMLRRPEPA